MMIDINRVPQNGHLLILIIFISPIVGRSRRNKPLN